MIRWLLWLLAGLVLGGIVHLAMVLYLPRAATRDAYARLEPMTPVNSFVPLPAPTANGSVVPFMDPAFAGRRTLCDHRQSGRAARDRT
jgi:uncharacterized membrane protein